MDIDFRKKLIEYGMTVEEYDLMQGKVKDKLTKRIAQEVRADKIKTTGKGIQSVGCAIMMIPIIGVLAFVLYLVIMML